MSTKKYEINQTCALLNVIPKSSEKLTLKLLYIFYKKKTFPHSTLSIFIYQQEGKA